MNSCVEYIKKYNYLKNMIKTSDQNIKMNYNDHNISMMFQIEKIRFQDQLEEIKKSELFNKCVK